MASASALVKASTMVTLFSAAGTASIAYAGHVLFVRGYWRQWATQFFTGPGRTSRVLLLVFVLLNVKSMPVAWTVRIFGAMLRHSLWPRKPLPRRALFHYSITTTRTSLMETDYNLHKSNSTYFSDLDISRSHLVMYLFGPGVAAVGRNLKTKLVRFPPENGAAEGAPVPGSFGVGLGAVFCSFRKEIPPYQPYEMWSRVLSWDRKWTYIVTHFVVKGKVRPPAWDEATATGPAPGKDAAWSDTDEAHLQQHVFATAVSKYVFKLGRFTVHPTYLIEASGLLPERPGEGWRGGGPDGVGRMADLDEADAAGGDGLDLDSAVDSASDAAWTWQRVERERRKGMELAQHFAALDGASSIFDGGKEGGLGCFGPG